VLVIGAHPDDAEFHAGGLIARHRRLGSAVKLISVTDGSAGHHARSRDELRTIRKQEAAEAAAVTGAESAVWSFPDGALLPTLELREQIITEVRTYRPDLLLTHRTNDYHPDHRAVGQAVQDASYLVTVPPVVPGVAVLRRDPVVAYMTDLFTRPCPMRPDVVLDVVEEIDEIVAMLACHRSQVFEWLPWHAGVLDRVPPAEDESGRRVWLREWFAQRARRRSERFRDALAQKYGAAIGRGVAFCEVYEVSEYAAPLDAEGRDRLFPE
jgi:LmbE family N-acetylglucosaminyl deacetylase